jgi:transglutaminase-like putative cysteine protease
MSETTLSDNSLFIAENDYIDYSNALIANLAKKLFAGAKDSLNKAKIAFEYVRDEIPHSFDVQADVITARASDVLTHKTGICHAKANLLAALLRSQAIPTGFCYQHLTLANDDSRGYCLHCFNSVYLNGQWIFFDARGNTNGKNAQFSVETPKLAFPNRAEYDEYCFNGVWATPDEPTMRLLKRAKDLRSVADGLPEHPATKPDIEIDIF